MRVYDPDAKEKEDLRRLIAAQYKEAPISTPISININYFMPIPKSLSKKKKEELMGKPHCVKGDIDNLLKKSFDAMNNLVYKDDAQIYEITAKKVYSDQPRSEINIYY